MSIGRQDKYGFIVLIGGSTLPIDSNENKMHGIPILAEILGTIRNVSALGQHKAEALLLD